VSGALGLFGVNLEHRALVVEDSVRIACTLLIAIC